MNSAMSANDMTRRKRQDRSAIWQLRKVDEAIAYSFCRSIIPSHTRHARRDALGAVDDADPPKARAYVAQVLARAFRRFRDAGEAPLPTGPNSKRG